MPRCWGLGSAVDAGLASVMPWVWPWQFLGALERQVYLPTGFFPFFLLDLQEAHEKLCCSSGMINFLVWRVRRSLIFVENRSGTKECVCLGGPRSLNSTQSQQHETVVKAGKAGILQPVSKLTVTYVT